jgi:choline dehydrogenase
MNLLLSGNQAEDFSSDVIVVGGGTAGAVVAARLAEDPSCRVLVIEAGEGFNSKTELPAALRFGHNAGLALRSGHVWSTTGVPSRWVDRPVTIPRGKVLGGTSTVDGRIHLWGHPSDYDAWGSPGHGWSFDEIHPYLRAIETDLDQPTPWHGHNGPIPVQRSRAATLTPAQAAFVEAATQLNASSVPDMNTPSPIPGIGHWPMTNIEGERRTSATEYLYPAGDRPNLAVLAQSKVERLEISGGRATGVVVRRNGQRLTLGADRIVLAAGTFGSPHILMLSGFGPERALKDAEVRVTHVLNGVGANLQDHPLALMVYEFGDRDARGDEPMLQVGWRMTSGLGSAMDLSIWPFTACLESTAQYPIPGIDPHTMSCRIAISLRKPHDSGSFTIHSADPDANPDVQFGYLGSDADVDRLLHGVDVALELERTPAWSSATRARIYPFDDVLRDRKASRQWLRQTARGSHGVGTCQMGDGPDAVVNWHGRVHGLDNLWVVDASIMPEIVIANPAATVMAMAERIANWIACDASDPNRPSTDSANPVMEAL